MTNEKKEGYLAIGAALLALFTAMLDARISLTIATAALVALGVNELRKK